MTGLTLGIDLGTSGIRSVVLDAEGAVLSMARADYRPIDPARIDAETWWTGTQSCIRKQITALQDLGHDPSDICRVGVDGTSGTMVLTDAALSPVTRALMYDSKGFDAEAKAIETHAPAPHITRGSNSALARMLRLQSEDTSRKAAYMLHQADFIAAKLVGVGGTSDQNNALKTGFDPETDAWPEWAAAAGVRTDLLPQVLPAGHPLTEISADVADDLGLSRQTMVHVGTTDSIAAFLASADLTPGRAVSSIGTTLAVKLVSPVRIDDPGSGLYSHKIGHCWLVGGASNSGGGVLLDAFSVAEIETLSRSIDPSQPSPLDYYPLKKPGERFPINDPSLPPRMTPRPASDVEYLHGLLESIARIEAQCYAAIVAQGAQMPTSILTAGGGANNPTWTAIRERVLGVPVISAANTEAAIGTARLIQSMG